MVVVGRGRVRHGYFVAAVTDELTRDRGTGDVDRQGHFTFPPFPRRPLTPSALFPFSHKIKEGDWLQETLGAKSLHEPFRVSHNLPG